MKTFKSLPLILLFCCFLYACNKTQPSGNILPESTPEEEGVTSASILTFLDSAANSKNELHGFVYLRHGKVIARGWWDPYQSGLSHTLYSTSKSFTATAVGFAVSEKLLSVEDRVISFFPDDLPDSISPFLAELKVRDLLSMSAGMDPDPTETVTKKDTNWIKGFLATPIVNKPGTKFLYNTLATYTLSAIVQRVTGEKIIDYLRPRLFTPLGIEGMDWEEDLRGINTGGWGLRLKTEDMARFGQLFLQKGKWNGKQIIPSEWIEEASSSRIEQAPDMAREKKDSSDWTQGYCYQMWRCRHNAFRADGAFGQFIIVMPDQDAVIAIHSETSNMQDEINLVWKYLLPGMKSGKLEEDTAISNKLHHKLTTLALPELSGIPDPDLAGEISGRTYTLTPGNLNMQSLTFTFTGNICRVSNKTNTGTYEISYGREMWLKGETDKPGPNLADSNLLNNPFIYPAKVAGSYAWKNDNTLELVLRYIESPHSEKLVCRFDHNQIEVDYSKSLDLGRHNVTLTGTAAK